MSQNRISQAATLTAADILDILERNFTCRRPGRFVLFREFPLEAVKGSRTRHRIDGLLVNLGHNRRGDRTAIEVKTSRDDFQRELRNPEKRQRAMRIADCFYFAVPYGLVEAHEVPEECGLYWIHPDEFAPIIARTPKFNHAPAPDWLIVRDMIWRAFAKGQEDNAKREPVAAWPEVEALADVAADPFAGDSDRELVLDDFRRALLRHGRRAEAGRIRKMQNGLMRALRELESADQIAATSENGQ